MILFNNVLLGLQSNEVHEILRLFSLLISIAIPIIVCKKYILPKMKQNTKVVASKTIAYISTISMIFYIFIINRVLYRIILYFSYIYSVDIFEQSGEISRLETRSSIIPALLVLVLLVSKKNRKKDTQNSGNTMPNG